MLNKKSILIIFLSWLAYLISYLGRSDYSSCLLEIVNQTGASRITAGMVSSVFALCNAFGQIASGFLMKKISPIKIITVELFSVAIINLLFPVTNSFLIMGILWGINGAMQSTLLCGMTQILAQSLKEPYISKGAVLLNTIGAVGGMFNYVLSWVLISKFNWQSVFFTVSVLLFIVGILWCVIMPKIATGEKQNSEDNETSKTNILSQITSYGTVFVIVGAFFVGLLRESVSLWIPSYMSEVFGFDTAFSTIITVFVPCLQICGALLGGKIGIRSKNLLLTSSIAFLSSCISLFTILILNNTSAIFTIILFVINAISMTAALTFLLSLFPIRYFGKGHVAMLVGIINFSVHAGDFVSSFSIGWLSQVGGWHLSFSILAALALFACILCFKGACSFKKEVNNYVKSAI